LFGADANPDRQLELRWSFLGARDDNVIADAPSSSDPRFQINGTYGTAAGTLGYTARGDRGSFTAHGGATGNYYPALQTLSAFDGNGDVAFTADLGRRKRTKISGYQGVRYQPYYQFNFLAGSAPSEAGSVRTRDNALTTRQSREY